MKTRFIIGPILIAVIVGLFLVDVYWLYDSRPCITLLILAIGAFGWLEFAGLIRIGPRGHRRDPAYVAFGFVAVLYFHVVAWWAGWSDRALAEDPTRPAPELDPDWFVSAGIWGLILGGFTLAVVRRDFSRHYRTGLETIVGVLLIGLLFSFYTRLYHLPGGFQLALTLFVGIKGTDVAAYLVGRTVGRHPVLPVSPKKTAEGFIAAFAWGGLWFSVSAALFEAVEFPWWQGLVFGIILSVVAQIGDLSESLIKREYNVKDSQALLPEFGGVLDLIDSLVFTGYLFWCLA